MEKLEKIQENVKKLLEKYPELRKLKNRKEAIWMYYKEYEGLKFGITKEMWLYHLTNPETISRCIRAILEKNPEFRSEKEEEIKRYNQAEIFREYFSNRKNHKSL